MAARRSSKKSGSADGFKACDVEIALTYGRKQVVSGRCFRGLALIGEPRAWSVTHIRSGSRLSDSDFSKEADAKAAILAVADRFPWEDDIDLDDYDTLVRIYDSVKGVLRARPARKARR